MGESLGWSGPSFYLVPLEIQRFTLIDSESKELNEKLMEQTKLKALEIKSAQFEKENEGLAKVNLKLTQELSVCESRLNDLQAKLSATSLEKVEAIEQLQSSQMVLEELKMQQISDDEKLQSQILLLMEEKNLLTESHENAKELETVIQQQEEQIAKSATRTKEEVLVVLEVDKLLSGIIKDILSSSGLVTNIISPVLSIPPEQKRRGHRQIRESLDVEFDEKVKQNQKNPPATIISRKDIGINIPVLEKDNYHHWKVKMHLHLLSQDESYINFIENGPHIPHKVATASTATVAFGQSISKLKAEWTIKEIRKDKKAMNIMFNGLDQDMFDNVTNSQTAKEVWDTVQIICEGTEQKLLNGLKLYGRVYQVKDSNLKFLRSLPKEWKPMTVSLRNSQDYKNFTHERLYGILKTYELEIEQDGLLEKGKRKGGSVALVADNEKIEARNEEKTMPSLKIGTSKSESSKGKEQVAEDEDNSSQDDSDDVDEH
ncbi:hypothetical protein AgCh_024312 [Apium graveolens]